jgi:Kdo2-lipid IVA lauroyltransferase/acyltransferase
MNPLVGLMRLLALLPLSWLRGLGWITGLLFLHVSARRRSVVDTNLRLCFPDISTQDREDLMRTHFILLGQSLWDRAWLWHAPYAVLEKRIQFEGDMSVFKQDVPLIVLAPHFVGIGCRRCGHDLASTNPHGLCLRATAQPLC